jgi:hypothetical protein
MPAKAGAQNKSLTRLGIPLAGVRIAISSPHKSMLFLYENQNPEYSSSIESLPKAGGESRQQEGTKSPDRRRGQCGGIHSYILCVLLFR